MRTILLGIAAVLFLVGAFHKKKKLDEFQPEVKKFEDRMMLASLKERKFLHEQGKLRPRLHHHDDGMADSFNRILNKNDMGL